MTSGKRPEDQNVPGWLGKFLVNFVLEGGIEFTFVVLRFVGHTVVALLTSAFHC